MDRRFLMFVLFLGLGALALDQGAQAAPVEVKISLAAGDHAKILRFLANKSLAESFSYGSPDLDSLPVVETVLIARALTLGGLDFTLTFVDTPNSERERKLVLGGMVALSGSSQWAFFVNENRESLFVSDVVIPDGSFAKGLYTTKALAAGLSVRSRRDLGSLSCVSNVLWKVDWATLQDLGFGRLESVPRTGDMFRMVAAGRAQVTLQSFSSNPDLGITAGGITLYPVPGVKVLLRGNRSFVVSQKYPGAEAIFGALQKGLATMKTTKEVTRALEESGFTNPKVALWTALDAP
jgi:hypothetical protein